MPVPFPAPRHGAAAALALLLAACGGSDPNDGGGGGGGGAPAALQIVSGNAQSAFAGNFPREAPTIRLVSSSNAQPIAGAVIEFTVQGGAGQVRWSRDTTDAQGLASVKSWRFGTVGAQALRAAVLSGATANPVTFSGTATAVPASAYNIEIRYLGTPPSTGRQAIFTAAAQRWSQLIVGDISNLNVDQACVDGQTGQEIHPAPGAIDDIVIYAQVGPIDGPGLILGQAGPCIRRLSNDLPGSGFMIFDEADVANLEAAGQFANVILHEMGHVLGFGTYWELPRFNLLRPGPCTTNTFFAGTSAALAFWSLATEARFPRAVVPVEDQDPPGGPPCPNNGTRDGHWKETDLGAELMTGFIEPAGLATPLSSLSVASLRDMGYVVNDAAADAFEFDPPANLRGAAVRAGAIELKDDILRGPIILVDDSGEPVRTIRR